jgi:hypothetical protein
MRTSLKIAALVAVLVVALTSVTMARERTPIAAGPALTSVGPMTFGPNGELLAADPMAAMIYSIDLGTQSSGARAGTADVASIDQKIGALLGTDAANVRIVDIVVHPTSKNTFVAVMRGQGTDAMPAIVRVDGAGAIDLVSLDNATFTSVTLPTPPAVNPTGRGGRAQSITDLAFSNGKVYVSGLSNEEFASKLYSMGYPFAAADKGTSVEIFHGNHGQLETRSPVMAFVPLTIGNQAHIVAGYTCTPLVKFPVSSLTGGTDKVLGTTMAEFGAGNQPLDIIVYSKGGQQYLLMSNSRRGVMKIPTAPFASAQHIGAPVREETGGVPFETIASMTGIEQMDLLDADRSVVIAMGPQGRSLSAVTLP